MNKVKPVDYVAVTQAFRWHDRDARQIDVSATVDAMVQEIAQARAEGRQEGIESALGLLIVASHDAWMTKEGLRWINSCYDQIKALLDTKPETGE